MQIEGAHALGVLGVSWASAVPRGSLTSGKAPGPPVRRFVSCGADNLVKALHFLLFAYFCRPPPPPPPPTLHALAGVKGCMPSYYRSLLEHCLPSQARFACLIHATLLCATCTALVPKSLLAASYSSTCVWVPSKVKALGQPGHQLRNHREGWRALPNMPASLFSKVVRLSTT